MPYITRSPDSALRSMDRASSNEPAAMASSSLKTNPHSSPRNDSSATSHPASKFEDFEAYARAHMYDPPHREKPKQPPPEGQRKPGGPCRITRLSNGALTEYGKKVEEQDRLYRLANAATVDKKDEIKEDEAGKAESSS